MVTDIVVIALSKNINVKSLCIRGSNILLHVNYNFHFKKRNYTVLKIFVTCAHIDLLIELLSIQSSIITLHSFHFLFSVEALNTSIYVAFLY